MFQLQSSHIQNLLQSQANQFMVCLGAGDFNYQTRDLQNGLYRERKSVIEKAGLRDSPKKLGFEPSVSQTSGYTVPNVYMPNPAIHSDASRREVHPQTTQNVCLSQSTVIRYSSKRTVEEVFKSYRLPDTSGPQWTRWRVPRSSVQAYNVPSLLPPSPSEPHAEIYMDIHEERMEGLSYAFEEAPMSLST